MSSKNIISRISNPFTKKTQNYQDQVKADLEDLKSKVQNIQLLVNEFLDNQKDIKAAINQLNENFETLELNFKKEENLNQAFDLDPSLPILSSEEETTKKEEVVLETFYMSRPKPEGSFSDKSKAYKFDPHKSVYEFKLIDRDPGIAKFTFLNNEKNILLAKSSSESFIEPACEIREEINENSTTVVTQEFGQANLEGENWVVVKKAVISFQ